ncbi:hypothetical protein POM88_014191 [Heracleum sosnowskyi]|uniref:Uncharacterized protein n=1 Tax=Heracleum sosnowskyi TaxID=360622 RepID=A0AAD8IZY1_9APIA|nr:hypothetical protein POM88_014191 [Heracleum sosnowskyi]
MYSVFGASYASGLIRSIQFLQDNWPLLCEDIRTGTLNLEITDNSVRKSVLTNILKADPIFADFIETECSNKSWKGIITRLWPNTKCIQAVVTGTMSQYLPTLEYYGNQVPLVSPMYTSSECYFGLYRFRVGDLLRVSGFKNKAPQFNFISRKNVALSIEADKTDESELQNAVSETVVNHLRPLNVILVDYTAYADTSTIPGHYVILWEYSMLDNGSTATCQMVPPSVFEDCCLAIEESLNSVSCRIYLPH